VTVFGIAGKFEVADLISARNPRGIGGANRVTLDKLAIEFLQPQMGQQRALLVWLANWTDYLEAEAREDDFAGELLALGIAWEPEHPTEPRANAVSRVDWSRRVRRLSERGLIERVGAGGRTHSLKITPLGREVVSLVNRKMGRVESMYFGPFQCA
jgi:hypothetical protein